MRMIDADALTDKLETYMEWENALYVQRCIDESPTIEAEPVVRCKDCKFYPDGEGTTKWTPCCDMITPPKWYCADGERKEDED